MIASRRGQLHGFIIGSIALVTILVAGCDESEDENDSFLSEGAWVEIGGTLAECHSVEIRGARVLIAAGREGFYSYVIGDEGLVPCGPRNSEWSEAPAGYGARSAVSCDEMAYFGVAVWSALDRSVYYAVVPEAGNPWNFVPVDGPIGSSLSLTRDCDGRITSFSTFACAYRSAECLTTWSATDFCYLFFDLTAIQVQCETWLFGQSAIFTPFVARVDLGECTSCPPTSVFPSNIDAQLEESDGIITGAGQLNSQPGPSIWFSINGSTSGLFRWSPGADRIEVVHASEAAGRLVTSPSGSNALYLEDSLYTFASTMGSVPALSLPEIGSAEVLGVDWSTGVVMIGIREAGHGRVRLYLRLIKRLQEVSE